MPGLGDLLDEYRKRYKNWEERLYYQMTQNRDNAAPVPRFAEHRITRTPVVIEPQEKGVNAVYRDRPPDVYLEQKLNSSGPHRDAETLDALLALRDMWREKRPGVISADPVRGVNPRTMTHEGIHAVEDLGIPTSRFSQEFMYRTADPITQQVVKEFYPGSIGGSEALAMMVGDKEATDRDEYLANIRQLFTDKTQQKYYDKLIEHFARVP